MPLFLPNLKAHGYLDSLHITIFNVGSRKINATNDNYGEQNWGIFAPNLSIYGFDADGDACEEANAELEAKEINWGEKHIPLALSNNTGEATLYVTKAPMCSSLYPPNEEYAKRFAGLIKLMGLDFTMEIETTTIDEFCELEAIEEVDFLQIDVQGAELLVLEGAQKLLSRSVLGIQLEVEFSPLYIGQPLFADLDIFLRNQQFRLFDILMTHGVYSEVPVRSVKHLGQLLWGEAFYLRDLISLKDKTPQQLFKLACVADALEFFDYAAELLEYLTFNHGREDRYNFAELMLDSYSQVPDLAKEGRETIPSVIKLRDYLNKKN